MVLISKTRKAINRADEACSINKLSKGKNDESIKKLGHIQEVCLTKNFEAKPIRKFPLRSKDWRVNELFINSCDIISTPVTIRGRDIDFLVDRGASCSMINFSVYTLLGLDLYQNSRLQVKIFCGRLVPIRSYVMTRISFEGKSAYLKLLVNGYRNNSNIPGTDSIKELRIDLNTIFGCNKLKNDSFNQIKRCIVNTTLITKFDPNLPVILSTDASSITRWIGTTKYCMHHKPSLINSENTAKLSEKFHQYLYGKTFEIVTDNKGILSFFDSKNKFSILASQRIQRWNRLLMAYNYKITFRSMNHHTNVDGLSRQPIGQDNGFDQKYYNLVNSRTMIDTPNNCDVLKLETKGTQSCRRHQNNISCEDDVLVMNLGFPRVVIPMSLQEETMKQIHEGHWGIVRAKRFAGRYYIGPCIDRNMENMDFTPWPKVSHTFDRVHIDFLGPFIGFMWLLTVEVYPQFLFILKMNVFSTNGIPKTLDSDGGLEFASTHFRDFCTEFGIEHVFSPPYHPESNGQAERIDARKTNALQVGGLSLKDLNVQTSHLEIQKGHMPLSKDVRQPEEMDNGRNYQDDRNPTIAYIDGEIRNNPAPKPSEIDQRSNKDSARTRENAYSRTTKTICKAERKKSQGFLEKNLHGNYKNPKTTAYLTDLFYGIQMQGDGLNLVKTQYVKANVVGKPRRVQCNLNFTVKKEETKPSRAWEFTTNVTKSDTDIDKLLKVDQF
ncbi:hypothetical protein RF11_12603 [Thelohanellus kitauei]|uniref:Integrase catalytic domain-containing protein n=1 Tax=Thelohanellus kitauei TaxID=669202 RepID=A0A0C2JNU7_THEKT|nr:hypothetical protein RF11_12603 [Thelohanellus kitauei]